MLNRDSEGIRGKTRIYLDILTKRLRICKKMETAAIFIRWRDWRVGLSQRPQRERAKFI